MKDFIQFIKLMSNKEKRAVINYLTLNKQDEYHSKTKNLFLYLLQRLDKENISNKDCSLALFNNNSTLNLKPIKNKLKIKILEVISNDFFLEKNEILDEIAVQSVKLRKRMSQFVMLYNTKSKSALSIKLLDKIINDCVTYEVYPVLIDALSFKRNSLNYTLENLKNYKQISEKLEKAILNHALFADIMGIYNNVRYLHIQQKKHHQLKNFLYHSIKKKERSVLASNSGLTLYFFYLLKIIYFENIRNFAQAAVYCHKLTILVKERKSVYRKNRLASAYHYSATIAIYGGLYEKAIVYSSQALALFPAHSINSVIAKEYIFNAAFYAKKFRVAKKYLASILNSKLEIDDFGKSKYTFWAACLDFAQSRYAKVLKTLLQKQLITKDKLGWDWQIRILSILCFIELNKFEEASNAIAALGQYIWRENKKEIAISNRQKRIYIILQKLSNCGFQFKSNKPELNKQLLLITKRNAWQPLTPELVRFDVWLKTKLRR